MEAPTVVVFWTCQDPEIQDWKWSELKWGNLRQGWGPPGTSLLERDVDLVPMDVWVKRYQEAALKYWGTHPTQTEAEIRFGILERMLHLDSDDVVVVPHMPNWNQFVIARVHMGYWFESPSVEHLKDHYGHIVSVDASDIKVYDYGSSNAAVLVSSRFGVYRKAVNIVRKQSYIDAVFEVAGI